MQSEDCPLFVDFGTCNTQIRVIHNGIVENPCRHGCIPSVVCVENGELQVVDSLYSCPRDGYALSVKRLLGKKKPELEAEGWTDAVHHCKVEFDAMQNPTLVLSYGMNGGSSLRVTPEDAVTVLLKKCKAVAEMHLKKPVTHCVLLVSNFSFQASRSALRSCAERAGLTVDSFVRESTAVGMGFGIAEEEHSILASKDLILVVDWGGAGLDLTLMHRKGNDFAVLGQGESSMLGGDSVDEVLCEYVQSRFRQDNNQELLNPASKFYRRRLGQLLRRCREAKEGVREHEGFSISLESPSHEEYALQLAPDAFARVIRGSVQCVEESVLALLQKCGKRVKDVRHVLLAGGSSNLQTLQHSLNRLFPDRVHVSESPQSLPVEGVAVAYLRHVAGSELSNTLDIDLACSVNGRMEVHLKSGTRLPTHCVKYYRIPPSEDTASIAIYRHVQAAWIKEGVVFVPSSLRNEEVASVVLLDIRVTSDSTVIYQLMDTSTMTPVGEELRLFYSRVCYPPISTSTLGSLRSRCPKKRIPVQGAERREWVIPQIPTIWCARAKTQNILVTALCSVQEPCTRSMGQ